MILIKTPAGRYAFAGFSVPFDFAYRQADGAPATEEQVATALHCGPGFVKALRAVSYATEAEAIADLIERDAAAYIAYANEAEAATERSR